MKNYGSATLIILDAGETRPKLFIINYSFFIIKDYFFPQLL